jgi:hypothetical protein
VNGGGQGFDQPGGVARRLRHPGGLAGQVTAAHEFERQVRTPLVGTDFVNLDDVGVVELADGLGFLPEPDQFDGTGLGAS